MFTDPCGIQTAYYVIETGATFAPEAAERFWMQLYLSTPDRYLDIGQRAPVAMPGAAVVIRLRLPAALYSGSTITCGPVAKRWANDMTSGSFADVRLGFRWLNKHCDYVEPELRL